MGQGVSRETFNNAVNVLQTQALIDDKVIGGQSTIKHQPSTTTTASTTITNEDGTTTTTTPATATSVPAEVPVNVTSDASTIDDICNVLLSQSLEEEHIIPFIQTIRDKQPSNLEIIVNKMIDQLNYVCNINKGKNVDADWQKTNITLGYLTRIIPFVMDQQSNDPECIYNKLFWNVSESGDSSSSPLAIRLMTHILDLLFMPGYTVDPSLASTPIVNGEPIPHNLVWLAGYGIESVPHLFATKAHWLNRSTVLQCLLVCLCEQLYTTQEKSYKFKSRWLDWISCTQNVYTEVLMFSLINTFCTYDPIGYGVPYNHLMFADDRENVAKLSIQIVNILLGYDITPKSPSAPPSPTGPPNPSTISAATPPIQLESPNKFILLLKSLKRNRDFTFFYTSFERILALPLMASHTRLPNSTKKIELHQDLLITFWRYITINHDFLSFVSNYQTSPEFLVPLLQYMDDGRKNQSAHGLVQLGTFILLVLSSERDFAISLNKNFTSHIVIDIPKPQGYSDFIIMVMYRLLVDNNDRLESIFECTLTVLSNLSPYMKNLSMVTCVKLMKLFEYLSSPRFLFANNHNHRYVQLLLESFNNLLQHQYESNTRLLYSILRCQNQFSKLAYLKITNSAANSPKRPGLLQQPLTHLDDNSPAIQSPQPPNDQKQQQQQEQSLEHQPPSLDKLNITSTSSTSTTTPAEQQNEQNKEQQRTPTIEHIDKSKNGNGGSGSDQEDKESMDQKHHVPTTITNNASSLPVIAPRSFIPTDEWLQAIKKQLPLDNILKVITALSPQIQRLCTGSGSDEHKIMEYLKMSTTVGLFNSSGPVMTRKYHPNPITKSWLLAYCFCVIYLENHTPPVFQHTNIQLFTVKH